MNIRPILKGISTFIPGLNALDTRGTGGSISARYCYSVWLRHLVMANENGLSTQPETIAELGPGDSFGIGLAALISGANKYYAFDVVRYSNNVRNVAIFDELINLFKKRENIPDEIEFPKVIPHLKSYGFPAHILTDERLKRTLRADRLEAIRMALLSSGNIMEGDIQILYFVPWNNKDIIKHESIDMIYSQGVLEHIDDPSRTYSILYNWLKSSGYMSHIIDFGSHGLSKDWNGHWGISDLMWRLIEGKRSFMLNRLPHSTHIKFLHESNFQVSSDIEIKNISGIDRKDLAPKFRNMSDDDLTTEGVFIQAVKKNL